MPYTVVIKAGYTNVSLGGSTKTYSAGQSVIITDDEYEKNKSAEGVVFDVTLAAPLGGGTAATTEDIQDAVGALLVAGTGINVNYNDAGNSATISTPATVNSSDAYLLDRTHHTGQTSSASISDFTEAAQDAINAMLVGASGVTLSYNDAANSLTITGPGAAGLDVEAVRDAIGVAIVGTGVISVIVNDAADTITITSSATQNSTDAALRDRTTHTGVQSMDTTQDSATRVAFTPAERTKLGGVATSATANSTDAALRARSSHTGTQDLDTTTDSATRLAMTTAERSKLAGVATSATANSSDATLKARANHTGTQTADTISDFAAVVNALITTAAPGLPISTATQAAVDSLVDTADVDQAIDGDKSFLNTVSGQDGVLDQHLATYRQVKQVKSLLLPGYDAWIKATDAAETWASLGGAGTALVSSAKLVINIPSSATATYWDMFGEIWYTADTTGKIRFSVALTGFGAVSKVGVTGLISAATGDTGSIHRGIASDTTTYPNGVTVGATGPMSFADYVGQLYLPASTAGVLTIRFGPTAGAGTVCQLEPMSHIGVSQSPVS